MHRLKLLSFNYQLVIKEHLILLYKNLTILYLYEKSVEYPSIHLSVSIVIVFRSLQDL